MGEKTKLRDACEYALKSKGKRFRPLIVMLTAEGIGQGYNVSEAAMAAEFFHTASLIADDLPSMDNEEERRGLPCTHKVYGESIALLSTYALICAAFEKITQNGDTLRASGCASADYATTLAVQHVSHIGGICGGVGGQYLDLFPPQLSLDSIKQIIYKKTVTLFEVSFVLGWIFGGGDLTRLDMIKRVALHFGMAFQIADDIGDLAQDEKKQKPINFARFVGKERSLFLFEEELRMFQKSLQQLDLLTPSFQKMSDLLNKQVAEKY
ncbi:MAG: polyprenyl synthetase family protein [Verrucomicrobia bacterium]|nr:polyprenyl synthetase family protein [Verrucomicrobiota bacterium]